MDVITAQRDYVTKVVRLMIWYVWHLSIRSNSVPTDEALDRHVDIMRKTTLFDGRHPAEGLKPSVPEWNALKTELALRIGTYTDLHTELLEDTCWALLEPYITPTFDRVVETRQLYGCWSYEIPDNKPHTIDIHFANGYRPESPFKEHWSDLVATRLQLIEDARVDHPAVTTIQCDSWLNQFEPFAALFPPSWRASFVPVFDYLATNGWWGQYKDERGAFHEKRAKQFRSTGAHPYSVGLCECDIEEVVKHLRRPWK